MARKVEKYCRIATYMPKLGAGLRCLRSRQVQAKYQYSNRYGRYRTKYKAYLQAFTPATGM